MKRTPLRRTGRLKMTPLRKRRKTRKGRIATSTLDAAYSKKIRGRDERCMYAAFYGEECLGNLEGAHMYSKQAFPSIRYELGNGNALCSKHHFFVHANPVKAGRFYEERWGREHLDALWAKAQAKATIDRRAVLESLRGEGG